MTITRIRIDAEGANADELRSELDQTAELVASLGLIRRRTEVGEIRSRGTVSGKGHVILARTPYVRR